jgi:hypothetical protein
LPSAESASSAPYTSINKFRVNRRKFLLQLRGQVLGWVGIAVAVVVVVVVAVAVEVAIVVAIAAAAAAARARVAVQAHRQHFEWQRQAVRAVRAQLVLARRRDHPAPNFPLGLGREPLPSL